MVMEPIELGVVEGADARLLAGPGGEFGGISVVFGVGVGSGVEEDVIDGCGLVVVGDESGVAAASVEVGEMVGEGSDEV